MRPYFLKTSALKTSVVGTSVLGTSALKSSVLKISTLSVLILSLHFTGSAQTTDQVDPDDQKDTSSNKLKEYDEIVIKRKGDKDSKVTVEIKDGQVFVNGTPVKNFNDDNVSVRIKSMKIIDGRNFTFRNWDGGGQPPMISISPMQPFGGDGGALDMDGLMEGARIKGAMLGVMSAAPEKEGAGAKIKEVSKGSAAEKAGLKAGDLITRVDEIAIAGPKDLVEAVHKYKPKDKITITYTRDGKSQKATAILGESRQMNLQRFNVPPQGGDDELNPGQQGWGGQDFRNLFAPPAPGSGARLGIRAQDTEDGNGVKVLDVVDDSPADKAGVKEGDLITSFDGKKVDNAASLRMMAMASRAKTSVKIALTRDGKPLELELKTPKKLRSADL